MKGTVLTGLGQNLRPSLLPLYERTTDLFLNKRQLFKVPFQERHLLLLSLTVAVSDHIVVLFTDFVQLNLQLNHLTNRSESHVSGMMHELYLLAAIL
jgi:hypothetical protein